MAAARIAVYTTDLSTGGVGRMRVNLIRDWVCRGHTVDLLLSDASSPLADLLPDGVRVHVIRTSHRWMSLPYLTWYLIRRRPDVLLTDRTRLNASALAAVALASRGTRVLLSVHLPQGKRLDCLEPVKRASEVASLRRLLPKNYRIIAVSRGVADDLVREFQIPNDQVEVVYNPAVVPDIEKLAAVPLPEPLFGASTDPLILAAGRMRSQKDFATLVRAFAILARRRPCRLAILGQGEQKTELEQLAGRLGLADRVRFPGYVMNPYQYMARADVFVLSSAWEGFGNVLAEALALGVPVVSTDCPYGPREILGDDGALGALVPVGDAPAMADAIDRTLDRPRDPERLKAAAKRFTVARAAARYLQAFGIETGAGDA